MTQSRSAVVGIGSNLGGRESLVRAACASLERLPCTELVARSGVSETAPIGPAQPRYLNAAAHLRTSLPAGALLGALLDIERGLGRRRRDAWGPRTLDLDVLWIDAEVVASPTVTVPHPELTAREFALRPLVELIPDARDPRDGALLRDRLAALTPDATRAVSPWTEAFRSSAIGHTADEGFVTFARDRADLLAAAAEAMASIMVDPASVDAARVVPVEARIDADAGDDERMFTWLAEVLHHLDATRFALRRAAVFEDGAGVVRGALLGDDLDESRHRVRSAIKAVTWHALEVVRDGEGWRAQVVIDV